MITPVLCIVIPTYKEKETLRFMLPKLKEILNEHFSYQLRMYKILLIDDTEEFETNIFEDENVIAIPRIGKRRGYAKSLITGLTIAYHVLKAKIIIQMDADHHYEDVIEFLNLNERFGDLIIGFEERSSSSSRSAGWLARKLLKLNYVQPTCGFRLWKNYVLDKMEWNEVKAKGFDIQLELTWLVKRQGWEIVEMGLSPESSNRYYDKSKMSIKQVFRHLLLYGRLNRKDFYSWLSNVFHGRK